ncbi:MAG: peptide-methionine (S)-S-oxide reductase MsrA [Rhodobacteraceae bacterium]|nr:peptide-methionine (S)-S-oxide reductase MsrA [Paracoccaceae bacterium]
MTLFHRTPPAMPTPETALRGRPTPIPTAETHFLSGRPLKSPVPAGMDQAMFSMGCFWGVERMFWQAPGVWLTMVGYANGFTPNPTYQEVCTGQTGHAEVVRVIFDPAVISYAALLRIFWEGHDPTQHMRQGNDVGTQYRSEIHCYSDDQTALANATRAAFAPRLAAAGFGPIMTEIHPAPTFYFAEEYHQQYLAKNPAGYCGVAGTGVTCPLGVATLTGD